MYHFLDTSAILNGALKDFQENIYISTFVLAELENIKTSFNKDEQIKYLARQAVQDIINSKNITYILPNQQQINKILKKYSFLSDIIDHKILCEAELLGRKHDEMILFLTADILQYLFALQMPHLQAQLLNKNEFEKNEYCGWSKHFLTEKQLEHLYSDFSTNILNCKINEYAEIYHGNELKDILLWNGTEYHNLNYKNIKNPYTGEIIKPLNLEQKMAFDLLQNKDIKVKLLTSAWGSGKTIIALNYALEQISRGVYSKMIFVRNNIIVADTNDIGFLPGDVNSKMLIWGAVIADHLGGQEMLDQLIENNVIEIYPLSHIRGRSIKSSIVICDECENLNDTLVTLLLSRIEKDSEIIFCGDVAQIDDKKFEKNNGIKAMINSLTGDPLFGMVKLIKSERGPVAKLCDKIRPPI